MDWITEHIALGGVGDLEHHEAGFDAILCCTMPGEIEYLVGHQIEFMRLPFTDGRPIPERLLLRAVGFITRQDRADHRVFVHSFGGISRSPSVVAAYLALADGIAPDVVIATFNPVEAASVRTRTSGSRSGISSPNTEIVCGCRIPHP